MEKDFIVQTTGITYNECEECHEEITAKEDGVVHLRSGQIVWSRHVKCHARRLEKENWELKDRLAKIRTIAEFLNAGRVLRDWK